jgi:hypothetical protein
VPATSQSPKGGAHDHRPHAGRRGLATAHYHTGSCDLGSGRRAVCVPREVASGTRVQKNETAPASQPNPQ